MTTTNEPTGPPAYVPGEEALPEGLRLALRASLTNAWAISNTGRRYAAEGRVTVFSVDHDLGLATGAVLDDDGVTYNVGHTTDGWFCGCPALICTHKLALLRVALPERLSNDDGPHPAPRSERTTP